MKKKIISLMLAGTMIALTACGNSNADTPAPSTDSAANSSQKTETTDTGAAADSGTEAAATGELVDGKFAETRHITVEG